MRRSKKFELIINCVAAIQYRSQLDDFKCDRIIDKIEKLHNVSVTRVFYCP